MVSLMDSGFPLGRGQARSLRLSRGLAVGRLDLVGPVRFDGGQVVMDLGDVQLEVLDRLEHQRGLDVRGVCGEPFQAAAEAVGVELLGGQDIGVGHRGGLGPPADAEEGRGLEQAVGDEDLDEDAQGDVTLPGLRVRRWWRRSRSARSSGRGRATRRRVGSGSGCGSPWEALPGGRVRYPVCQESRSEAIPSARNPPRGVRNVSE
jgi:hypothetical protein